MKRAEAEGARVAPRARGREDDARGELVQRPAGGPSTVVTPEQRREMVAQAAYFKAQRRGYEGGSPQQDWCEAEAEVDEFLMRREEREGPLSGKPRAREPGFNEGDTVLDRAILGWLGTDRLLYCSEGCAFRAGQRDAKPMDEDDFDALTGEAGFEVGATCPTCGARYPVVWAEQDEE